jgi:hypothetical protein
MHMAWTQKRRQTMSRIRVDQSEELAAHVQELEESGIDMGAVLWECADGMLGENDLQEMALDFAYEQGMRLGLEASARGATEIVGFKREAIPQYWYFIGSEISARARIAAAISEHRREQATE